MSRNAARDVGQPRIAAATTERLVRRALDRRGEQHDEPMATRARGVTEEPQVVEAGRGGFQVGRGVHRRGEKQLAGRRKAA